MYRSPISLGIYICIGLQSAWRHLAGRVPRHAGIVTRRTRRTLGHRLQHWRHLPGMRKCQKRPITRQKRPVVRQKRPTNTGAISQETIPFGAEPIPSGNYRNPSCQQYVPPDAQGAAARLGLCRSAMLLPAALLALMLSRFF